jgi:O-antigen/teichoic acid export membrane protein
MGVKKSTIVHFLSQILTSISGFLATLLIARYLGAETLGNYAVVVALLFWVTIPTGAINSAMIKRISESDKNNEYFSAGAIIICCFALVIFFLSQLGSGLINKYVGAQVAFPFALIVIADIIFHIGDAPLRGKKAVDTAGLFQTLERILRTGFQVGLIFAGYTLSGLIYGHTAALVTSGVIAITVSGVSPTLPNRTHFKKIIEYARYAWAGTLESRSFVWADTIILKFFVASSLIGIYEVAWTLAATLGLLVRSVNQTLFPEISELSAKDQNGLILDYLNSSFVFIGIFIIPGFFGSMILGERLLRIYGSEFVSGSLVLLVLIVSQLFYGFGGQFRMAINGIDRPDIAFRISIATILSNIALNFIFIYQFGWYGAAIATTVSAGVSLILSYRALGRLLGTPTFPWKQVGFEFVASIGMSAIIFVCKLLLPTNSYVTVTIVFIGAFTYMIILIGVSGRIRKEVISLVPVSVFKIRLCTFK